MNNLYRSTVLTKPFVKHELSRFQLDDFIKKSNWKEASLEVATAVCVQGLSMRVSHMNLFESIFKKYQQKPNESLLSMIANCVVEAKAEHRQVLLPIITKAIKEFIPNSTTQNSVYVDLCHAADPSTSFNYNIIRLISPAQLENDRLSRLCHLLGKTPKHELCNDQISTLETQLLVRRFENFNTTDVGLALWGASKLRFSQDIFKHGCEQHVHNFPNCSIPYSFLCSNFLNSCNAVGYCSEDVLDEIRLFILKRGMTKWKLQHILSLITFAAALPEDRRPHVVLYAIEEEFARREEQGEDFAHYVCQRIMPSWNKAWHDHTMPRTLGRLTAKRQAEIGEQNRLVASMIQSNARRPNPNPDPLIPFERLPK